MGSRGASNFGYHWCSPWVEVSYVFDLYETPLTTYSYRILDHWAHLGGAAFGAWYYLCGPKLWNELRLVNSAVASPSTLKKDS